MRIPNRPTRPAFTLLELMAAVVVMSIIAAVLLPIVATSSEAYTQTRRVRSDTERVAFALDRITRIVRQAPIGESGSGVGVDSATATGLAFTDGTGFELNGTTLEMLVPTGGRSPLCTGVETMSIDYLADDPATDMIDTPTRTRRFVVTIRAGQVEMRVLIHPRVWIGQEDS